MNSENFAFVSSNKKPFRILSLDGGGVRAIMHTILLKRLCEICPNFLDQVDLFAGTSAGAIVASALVTELPPDETIPLYEQEIGILFKEGFSRRVISFDNAIGSAYDNTQLKEFLSSKFGKTKLADLKKKIFIPSFHLDCTHIKEDNQPISSSTRWSPEFFHNLPNSKNSNELLSEVVLRTTAAPTYFPIYQAYIDGGVVANNPSLCAVSTTLASKICQLDDIVVLSLSTGSNPKGIPTSSLGNGNWGLFEWGPHIVDLLLDSSTESIDYQSRCILNERYHRLDPLLPNEIGLDDASAIKQLKDFAEKVDLSSTLEWIEKYWNIETSPIEETTSKEDIPTNWRCSIM
jgi:patatin-like phospholipase/acyl hydrolase